jgi:hypothetical protein
MPNSNAGVDPKGDEAMKKPEPKPFFQTRNDFLPSLENFVNCAMNLYNTADILCGGDPFPGQDILRKRVAESRASIMEDEEDA